MCECECCMAFLMSVFINFKRNLIWIAAAHLIKILFEKQFLGMRITLIVWWWWGSFRFTFTCSSMHHITSWNFKAHMNDEWMPIPTKNRQASTFTSNLEFWARPCSCESCHRSRIKELKSSYRIVLRFKLYKSNSVKANQIIDLYCVKRDR